MNRGSLFTILGSLVLAGIVAWMGNAWIEKRLSSKEQPPEMVRVLVAAKDIPIDTKLDETLIKSVEMPPASAPAGYLTSPDKILGKRLKEPIYQGEPILARRLLADSDASLLSVTLTPGKRALAVKVDDIIGVSGFILPGSHVDVIATGEGQGTRTVLQDIKVLTVGQALKAEGGTLRVGSVTLEVDPRQAEILTAATLNGSVRLALRHQLDRAFVDLPKQGTPERAGEAVTPAAPAEGAASAEPQPSTLLAANTAKQMRSIIVIKGMNQTLTGTQWEVQPETGTPETTGAQATPEPAAEVKP
jgi:pilus assembly protein CpaB